MISIRAKFVFTICVLFIFIACLIYIPLSQILPAMVTSQILKKEVKIAQYIANDAKEYILTNNNFQLSLFLHLNLDRWKDIQYLFVRSSDGAIIASTFDRGFPRALLNFNSEARKDSNIKEFLQRGRKVYDISVPIFGGEVGTLHLGVSLESSQAEIAAFSRLNYYVGLVIFLGLGIGIVLFAVLGLFISRRIIKLKDFADKIGTGDLDSRIDMRTRDEIGVLAASFNKMAADLKEKINQIKRLSYLEERSRIAIEFHDGIAQDLANIIKRLELCEELFKNNPGRGFLELKTLSDNTKDILNKTRQAIFDLKLPLDADFDLLNSLKNYIKDYQGQYNIKVKFAVFGFFNNIPADKLKSIFCIITEALTNIRKHAQASNAELRLEYTAANELVIDIKDDGRGFDLNQAESSASNLGKWGLMSMRQRTASLGGTVVINTVPNLGTEIFFDIPLGQKIVNTYRKD